MCKKLQLLGLGTSFLRPLPEICSIVLPRGGLRDKFLETLLEVLGLIDEPINQPVSQSIQLSRV